MSHRHHWPPTLPPMLYYRKDVKVYASKSSHRFPSSVDEHIGAAWCRFGLYKQTQIAKPWTNGVHILRHCPSLAYVVQFLHCFTRYKGALFEGMAMGFLPLPLLLHVCGCETTTHWPETINKPSEARSRVSKKRAGTVLLSAPNVAIDGSFLQTCCINLCLYYK